MRTISFVTAALFFMSFLAAHDAAAFTIDNDSGTNPDGTARYVDPDDQPLPAPLGGVTVMPSGHRYDEAPGLAMPGSASDGRPPDVPGWFSSSVPRH